MICRYSENGKSGRFISEHKKFCKNSFLTLTQSCFSCLSTSSLGCPSFQAVKSVLHVASDVPIVPPVNVKLVPSENVYVPSVVLRERLRMRSAREQNMYSNDVHNMPSRYHQTLLSTKSVMTNPL